jgi:hypothetical protein
MLYNMDITAPGRATSHRHLTAIQAQRAFEDALQRHSEFMIKLTKYACKHHWTPERNHDSITFTCLNCGESFDLANDDISAYAEVAKKS